MINISKKAEEYLNNLLISNNKKKGLRVSIKYPGTQYAECKISYNSYKNIQNTDIEIKYLNFSIYINRNILLYFKDSKIDFLKDGSEQQLVLIAPYAKKIITNSSEDNNSLFLELQKFIEFKINTMLSSHGGKIILVKITKLRYAVIRFLGGCNGCSMVNVTLRDGIEKRILKYFPMIKGVKDITNHRIGDHSFF